jgi:hypothetical protein
MKHVSPLLFLICFFPTTLLANSHASQSVGKPQTQPKHEFAFVIDCFWTKRKPNICLLGKYKRGTPITLLEIGRSRTCLLNTEESGDYEGEITAFPFTSVSPATKCGDASLYSIAVLGSRICSYQIVKMEEIIDKTKVQSLDKFVRSKNVLETLRQKAQGTAAEDYELPNDLPIVHRYPIPKMEIFILSYKTLLGEFNVASGPRAIIINSIAYPLTGWCSYPYMRGFCLNGEYYIESGSHCCECGTTIKELFKMKQTGPVEVHSDSSLSD